MRVTLDSSQPMPRVIFDGRAGGMGCAIKVIDAGVTIFLSQDPNDLQPFDGTGAPRSGLPLTSSDPPLVFPKCTSIIYGRSSAAQVGVEVLPFKVG